MDDDLQRLLEYADEQGFKIVRKHSKEMYGYLGLHWLIDRKLGLKIPINEIWIDANLHNHALFRTLNHELIEISRMRDGASYWVAHRYATKHENDENWFREA
jgi:hypothetical protein